MMMRCADVTCMHDAGSFLVLSLLTFRECNIAVIVVMCVCSLVLCASGLVQGSRHMPGQP